MRTFTHIAVLSFFLLPATVSVHAQTKAYVGNTASPYATVKNLDMGEVKWTKGFWQERFDLCQTNVIPAQWEYFIERTERNFEIVAQNLNEPYWGSNWMDGDYYKWIEAQVVTYSITKDPELLESIEKRAKLIANAQASDGYITMNTQIGFGTRGARQYELFRPFNNTTRFANSSLHETYNMGHLMTLATTHYRVTGSRTLLDVAVKAADYLDQYFAVITPELSRLDFNPTHIMGLVEIYRSTGNKKYLDLAQRFVDARGKGGELQNQNKTPLRREREAVGHAVLANVLYIGAADIYAETGEKALLDALSAIWEDMYFKKSSITGGLGNQHWGAAEGGVSALTHESFGPPYKLDNATAYNETCANFYGAFFSWRMFTLTGDPKYLDRMEWTFYNNLSSMALDGKSYFYTNPMRWFGKDHVLLSQDYHGRWQRIGCVCCPTSVARFLTETKEFAYAKDERSIYVALYGSNEVNTKVGNANVKLIQQSDYPWNPNITFIYDGDADAEFALKLRIPSWANKAALKVNSDLQSSPKAGSFAELNRNWKKGDKVELTLPLEPVMLETNPKVEEVRNQIAVSYGPIIYCVEQFDLPEDVNIDDILIPANAELKPEFKKDFLGGIMTIKVDALARTTSFDKNALYAPVDVKFKPLKLTMIPYYVWANRGENEMSVFFPVVW